MHDMTRVRPDGSLRPTGRLRRLGTATLVVAVVALLAGVVVPAAGRSLGSDAEASGEASSLLSLLNQARANNGLAPLSSASDLTAIAADRASTMARSGSLAHTPDLGGRACCWTWIAENVAYAGSVQSLHDVLMNSAPHRANILNADADDVGVAVVQGDGMLWAAQVFRARSDSDRTSQSSTPSRAGDRDVPPSSSSTGTATGSSTIATLSPVDLARIELRQHLHQARQDLRATRSKEGRFDPVRAAVTYTGTLDAVSR
jgi:hypothetical protein